MMELVNESQRPITQSTQRFFSQLMHILAMNKHFTLIRRVETAQQVRDIVEYLKVLK